MIDFLILPVAVPLAATLLLAVVRRPAVLAMPVAAAVVTAVTMLAWQVATLGPRHHAVGGWGEPLGIELRADALAVVMLGLTAAVGVAVSRFARSYFRETAQQRHFWPLWLALWSSLNALFLSADLFNVYVTLELMGLSAVALTALAGGRAALRAAMTYLLVGVLGSLGYLLGVALIYGRYAMLDLTALSEVVGAEPVVWVALAVMTVSLMLKAAVFPLHFWLPPAHASAPAPVSAALSAVVVKASFYVLLRLWFEVAPAAVTEAGAQVVGALGAGAVLWGSLRALRAERLKLLAAYSTVAQVGYLFIAFPLVWAAGSRLTAWTGVIYLALSHALAKAALFLAVGNIQHSVGHDRIAQLSAVGERLPLTTFALALAGISLIGLPPSGGFLGKWLLLNAAFTSGQWWWVLVVGAGTLLAAAYAVRVLRSALIRDTAAGVAALPGDRRAVPALMLGLAATLLLGLASAPLVEFLTAGSPLPGGVLVTGRR